MVGVGSATTGPPSRSHRDEQPDRDPRRGRAARPRSRALVRPEHPAGPHRIAVAAPRARSSWRAPAPGWSSWPPAATTTTAAPPPPRRPPPRRPRAPPRAPPLARRARRPPPARRRPPRRRLPAPPPRRRPPPPRAPTTATSRRSPRRPAGPYPADGTNGPERAHRERRRAQRHPRRASARSSTSPTGVPLTIKLTIVDSASDGAAARRRRRLPLALRPGGPLLAVLAGRHRRELPAGRPGGRRRRHAHVHEHLPGRPTPAAGRTSTSRSTRASAEATTAGRKLATSQLALPRGRPATPCTPPTATRRASATWPRSRSTSDNVFRDGVELQTPTVSGSVESGVAIALTVAV